MQKISPEYWKNFFPVRENVLQIWKNLLRIRKTVLRNGKMYLQYRKMFSDLEISFLNVVKCLSNYGKISFELRENLSRMWKNLFRNIKIADHNRHRLLSSILGAKNMNQWTGADFSLSSCFVVFLLIPV